MNIKNVNEKKLRNLYVVLAGFFIANAIVAEVVGVKIFSVEKLLGIAPLHLSFFGGYVLDCNLSVGILIWPFVFILTDILNEYFGKTVVTRISYLTSALIAYAFFIILGGTSLPAADFWMQINNTDPTGNPFNIDYAYSVIFRQGLGIIVGSITAFLIGQVLDAYVFHYIRVFTGHGKLWLRATGSTVISQFVDSFLILFIAFYWLGNWSLVQVLSVGIMQYIYKVLFAIVLTPAIYLLHKVIDRYLGKEQIAGVLKEAEGGA